MGKFAVTVLHGRGHCTKSHLSNIYMNVPFFFFFLNHWKIKLQGSNFIKAFYHFYQFPGSFLRTQPCLTLCQSGTSAPFQHSHQYATVGQIFKWIAAFRLSLASKLCKYFLFKACLYFPEKS